MKASNYNYIYHTKNFCYFYNGIKKSYFRCSKELGSKIEYIIKHVDEYEEQDNALFTKLKNGGFVVDDDTNEITVIREAYRNAVHSPNYQLTIIPTLNCNFKCYYCVQDHIVSKMSEETIAKVKEHIKFMIFEKKISSLTIEWFGGEPFMYFEEIIKPISQFAKQQCGLAGIPFYNGSTTNGALITLDVAKQLGEINCNRFQITLDGDRVLHNSIKFSSQITSAFDTTIKNITHILTENPYSQILLRINYTSATLQSNIVETVTSLIPSNLRKRIKIILKKVWQDCPDNGRFDSYLDMLDKFKEKGFNIKRLDIIDDFLPCYTNKEFFNCINYDGGVIKCTNCDLLYAKDAPGKLLENNDIAWKDGFDKKNQEAAFENEKCIKCKLLPICMSHCPKQHIDGDTKYCKFFSTDVNLRKAIIAYINDEMGI